MKKTLIFTIGYALTALLLIFNLTVYTEESPVKPEQREEQVLDQKTLEIKSEITVPKSIPIEYEHRSFLSLINSKAYAAPVKEKDDEKYLREQWKQMLGMDVFMPYFKARDVEDFVKEKTRTNFFKMKGEPKLNKDQLQYMFNVKF